MPEFFSNQCGQTSVQPPMKFIDRPEKINE